MSAEGNGRNIHVGRNIDALQQQLGVSDEQMLQALGLSYNRFWDMKRREWAQKKTVEQVATALTSLAGQRVTAAQVLSGRMEPEDFAVRAVKELVRQVESLAHEQFEHQSGVRLPRLHLGSLPAGPVGTWDAGEPSLVVRADAGDFVVTADGDCMLPTIGDGDELVCRQATAAEPNDIAVVSYADEAGEWQHGVKRVRREGNRVWLTCDNLGADSFGRRVYPDIHPTEIRIHGIVVGLWRPLR